MLLPTVEVSIVGEMLRNVRIRNVRLGPRNAKRFRIELKLSNVCRGPKPKVMGFRGLGIHNLHFYFSLACEIRFVFFLILPI